MLRLIPHICYVVISNPSNSVPACNHFRPFLSLFFWRYFSAYLLYEIVRGWDGKHVGERGDMTCTKGQDNAITWYVPQLSEPTGCSLQSLFNLISFSTALYTVPSRGDAITIIYFSQTIQEQNNSMRPNSKHECIPCCTATTQYIAGAMLWVRCEMISLAVVQPL